MPARETLEKKKMSNEIIVKAKTRQDTGSAAMGRLRRSGWIPSVIYGAKHPAKLLQINVHDFEMMLSHHASESMMLDLVIDDGKPKKVLLKSVQHHPVYGKPVHVDFQAVDLKRKLHAEIAVELKGHPKGVEEGGVLESLLRNIEVACLPDDLVESFEVDVSSLKIGDSLTVGDLPLDRSRYDIITHADIAVAAVASPRVAEPDAEEAEEAGVKEPEVIGSRTEEDD